MTTIRYSGKTLLSLVACAASLVLLTATSRSTFQDLAKSEVNETLLLDSEGTLSGVLSVRFDAKELANEGETPTLGGLDSSFRVFGEDARRSLRVSEVGVDDDEERVRKVFTAFRNPSDCWEAEEPEEVVDCELSVALEFTGKKDKEETVSFSFEIGGWDLFEDDYEIAIHALTWTPDTE